MRERTADPAHDLWQISYAKPPANWHRHVRIYRQREDGAPWSKIARDHGLSHSAPKRSYDVVAEHLDKLAETGGAITPDMTLARCPGVSKRLVNALERNGIVTLREAACCREEDLRWMPWLGRLGIEELKRLMEIAEPWRNGLGSALVWAVESQKRTPAYCGSATRMASPTLSACWGTASTRSAGCKLSVFAARWGHTLDSVSASR